jgi:hypothetical protein
MIDFLSKDSAMSAAALKPSLNKLTLLPCTLKIFPFFQSLTKKLFPDLTRPSPPPSASAIFEIYLVFKLILYKIPLEKSTS